MQIATINKVINNVPSISIKFVAQNRISSDKKAFGICFYFYQHCFVGANIGFWLD